MMPRTKVYNNFIIHRPLKENPIQISFFTHHLNKNPQNYIMIAFEENIYKILKFNKKLDKNQQKSQKM